ncbi:MAG TPA: DUF423 domain-containing protein [Reyranella sp.]|nr:DUF423 domain-containing protein [Reyranella sp.]
MVQLAAVLLIYAGLAGAAGVGIAAAGAHGNDMTALTSPAYFLIMHATAAAAIIAVATRAEHPGAFLLAALVLLVGASLFSGDIAARTLWSVRLFPMAAPIGGSTMIIGWLLLSVAGIWEVFSQRG